MKLQMVEQVKTENAKQETRKEHGGTHMKQKKIGQVQTLNHNREPGKAHEAAEGTAGKIEIRCVGQVIITRLMSE